MVKEKTEEVYFCKNYEAHNRTFWYLYPLLQVNTKCATLLRIYISKSNLYINDAKCPYKDYNENMLIYCIKIKEYTKEEEVIELDNSLKTVPNFVYSYDIGDNVKCYIYELKEIKAEIYKQFRNSKYSKMNIPVTLNRQTFPNYSKVFESFSGIDKRDQFCHKVYHTIKRTELGQYKLSEWLGIKDVKDLELDSLLKQEEEILRYDK
jgi:hypothetical protein